MNISAYSFCWRNLKENSRTFFRKKDRGFEEKLSRLGLDNDDLFAVYIPCPTKGPKLGFSERFLVVASDSIETIFYEEIISIHLPDGVKNNPEKLLHLTLANDEKTIRVNDGDKLGYAQTFDVFLAYMFLERVI